MLDRIYKEKKVKSDKLIWFRVGRSVIFLLTTSNIQV